MGVVLVTGASSGIGKVCAEHLAQAGHRVYGTSRHAPPVAALDAVPPAASGSGVTLVSMEVTDDVSVASAIDGIVRREQRIDVVVNNAGYGLAGSIEDTSVAEAQAQLDANFFGVVRVCRAVLPRMRAQKAGCIVNISSMAGLVAIPFQAYYSASKFALEGFSAALRSEVHPFGIRVVVIRPGDFQTGFTTGRRRAAAWDGSPYRAASERALRIMEREEQAGPSPARIGELVARVAAGQAKGDRFIVGNAGQRALIALRRVLPESGTDLILRRHYEL
jgi:short-subunit dehydrogenase